MIYTVTFNPAIDYVAEVNDLKMNDIIQPLGENYGNTIFR